MSIWQKFEVKRAGENAAAVISSYAEAVGQNRYEIKDREYDEMLGYLLTSDGCEMIMTWHDGSKTRVTIDPTES